MVAESLFSLYDIHGLVKVASAVSLMELEPFRCRSIAGGWAPDVVVSGHNGNSRRAMPGRHFVVRNGLRWVELDGSKVCYRELPGGIGVSLCITYSSPILVEVSRAFFVSPHVLYVNVLEPLIRLVLASKNYALLHSACVSNSPRAFLISAPPDTGKTSVVLNLVKHGFGYMSDDMTILAPNCQVLSFPKPMTISPHTYSSGVAPTPRLGRLVVRLKGFFHSKNGRRALRQIGNLATPIMTLNALAQLVVPPPKAGITHVSPKTEIVETSKARSLYLIWWGPESIRIVGCAKAVDVAISNNSDAFVFPPMSEIFRHAKIGGRSYDSILETEQSVLRRAFSQMECLEVLSNDRRWAQMVIAREAERENGGALV